MDLVETAIAFVPEAYYVIEPDGRPLPQSSNPRIIAAMLRLCDIPAGARVLEVSTGSGFSTALLSYLVGPSGSVVSLDIDVSVADRARRLLSAQRVDNVIVLAGDGQRGFSGHAPFDLVVSWATAEVIPHEWVSQVKPGGSIVAPVSLGPLAHAIAVVRLRRDREHGIIGEHVIPGSFIPLSETPQSGFGNAPADADIVLDPDSDPATWVSSLWLRGTCSQKDRETIRKHCFDLTRSSGIRLPAEHESAEAFFCFLLCPTD